MNQISTEQLAEIVGSAAHRIIDVRQVDAYNGWALEGEARGGHVRGAKTIPVSWTDQDDWAEIVQSKDVLPQHQIVVYGYSREDEQEVAQKFLSSGYGEVSLYSQFVEGWAADHSRPMDSLARFDRLVSPQWVSQLIGGQNPPGFGGGKYAVCHCHYRNEADYDKGHIPGAIALDTLELESPETWNRRSPQELEEALCRLGITADTTVVVYGRYSSPSKKDPHPGSKAGQLGSLRCAAIMMYAGVRDVRVLNGSISAWGYLDYPVSTEEVRLDPVTKFGAQVPARPEIFIDTPEAKEVLSSPDKNLVSVRSWPEFLGEVSGYNYIERTGRIPGAVFGNCGSDAYHMENYRNVDLTTREYHEVERMWAEAGISRDKFNAFYCGTGWRGSEAFMNAYLLGWDNIAVYDGGWFEWSADVSNPIGLGEP